MDEIVTEAMAADSIGSGDVDVLGTPAVLALVERAAVQALRGQLDPGQISVGSEVELSHLAPTPVGAKVRATSRLTAVDGPKITFEFSVADPSGEIARGHHRRVIVDREKFLRSASSRTG